MSLILTSVILFSALPFNTFYSKVIRAHLSLFYCSFFFLRENNFCLDTTLVKMTQIKAERRVLKELGFCVHIKHPHKLIVMYLQVLRNGILGIRTLRLIFLLQISPCGFLIAEFVFAVVDCVVPWTRRSTCD